MKWIKLTRPTDETPRYVNAARITAISHRLPDDSENVKSNVYFTDADFEESGFAFVETPEEIMTLIGLHAPGRPLEPNESVEAPPKPNGPHAEEVRKGGTR